MAQRKTLSDFFGYDLKIGYYVFYLMRIQFWVLSIGTFYIGYALATKNILPDVIGILGILTIGPFLGGFALLYNECCDLEIDIKNPRKVDSPLLQGLIKKDTGYNVAITLALLTVILATVLSYMFAIFVLALTLLAILYSHPRIRLKNMPGIDLLVNMTGFGTLCPLSGWVLFAPLKEFPFLFLIPTTLIIGGLYTLTTVLDYDADKSVGLNTIATKIGKRNTLILGWFLITFAVVSSILKGYFEYLITREILYRILPIFILQIAFYPFMLRKITDQNIIATIFIVVLTNAIGIFLFLLYYTGIWRF